MNLTTFKASLTAPAPPPESTVYLQALWYEAKGDWDKAHVFIQDLPDQTAAWIHAYLHRREGDTWNADYWYSRAGRKRPAIALQEEWESIATALLMV
ncbi:hypothetical protein [Pontibacter virosus]|uniref:Uncharacterized protein n=1 Tax=Pontibacter virosus TaxID=1765052 RepID=A0A2U1AZH7_9BACT|nr:hypothetical protein [Pontibacter virosus]PVY41839.1 hypothetical protein C8E01_104211 [Pontibacter virosus]